MEENSVPYRLVVDGQSIRRLDDILRLGLQPENVVKSLLLRYRHGAVVASIPMDRKLNVDKISELLGSGIGFLSRNEVQLYGYEPGAIPPIYHRNVGLYILDRSLLDHTKVYSGSGEPEKLIEIDPVNIIKKSNKPIIIDAISD